jgi:hypothetical protein
MLCLPPLREHLTLVTEIKRTATGNARVDTGRTHGDTSRNKAQTCHSEHGIGTTRYEGLGVFIRYHCYCYLASHGNWNKVTHEERTERSNPKRAQHAT